MRRHGLVLVAALALGAGCGTSDNGPGDGNTSPTATPQQGYASGNLAQDWMLLDGAGNQVNLWDFAGRVIFFEEGSEW